MDFRISSDGVLEFTHLGRKIASANAPLEMEKEGKSYQGLVVKKRKESGFGLLADEKGPFLSCNITFQKKIFNGMPILIEKREYRAIRDISKALLIVRYFLEPVNKREDGFLVIPALWYGDNEAWNDKAIYPKGLDKDWSFKADGSSCPSVVWTTPKGSYAVATDHSVSFPTSRPGLDDILGIGFAQMSQRPQAVFTFPAQEIPKSYPWGRKLKSPLEPRVSWKKGQTLTLTFYHSAGKPDKAFHTKVWRAHLKMTGKPVRYHKTKKELIRTARLFSHCLQKSHYREGMGFSHRQDVTEIFTGWCGGLAAAYSALKWGNFAGDAELRRMGETMADFICARGISPSGLFYSEYTKDLWLQKVYWAKGKGLHMRCASEGAGYLSLMLRYEKLKGQRHPLWESALRQNLGAILKMQRPSGEIPHEVDGKTGKAISWVGATAGAWAGALAVWSELEHDKTKARIYLKAAEKTGHFYLKEYVENERYIGGPYDTYMAPNMEDPYNFLMAYGELYRVTKNKIWLKTAQRVADHLLSWRYLYNVRFPNGTLCHKEKVKTYQMSPASVCNKHIQNWDTLADTYLLDLSRWLKDPFYSDCAQQHLAASTQLVQRGQLPKAIPYGGQSEQWYATTFNWFGNCGDYSKGNLWKITVALPKAGYLISLTDYLEKKK